MFVSEVYIGCLETKFVSKVIGCLETIFVTEVSIWVAVRQYSFLKYLYTGCGDTTAVSKVRVYCILVSARQG